MPDVDILVAGAGPVGLYTAITAARAGFSVAVTDPRRQPIDKACGEGLMPSALRDLQRIGVDPLGHVIRGIAYVSRSGQRASHDFRSAVGRGVRRTILEQELLRRAEAEGVKVLQDRVIEFQQHADHVQTPHLTSRWLIAADGLHSRIRDVLGLTLTAPGPSRFGLRRHFEIAPWSDLVEVHWGASSEAYVTPLGANLVGVALLGPRGMHFDSQVKTHPQLASMLAGAAGSRVRGAGPLRVASSRRRAHRVFLIGDAAGYVDALTGEGLTSGFAQAQALVTCLVRGRPADYEASWVRATRRRDLLTRGVLALANSRARTHVVTVARRAPWLFAMGVEEAS